MSSPFIPRPHELGMPVVIDAPRSHYHGQQGVIDEIAIYRTESHGIDFAGWELLVAFYGPTTAYSAFNFDEAKVITPLDEHQLKEELLRVTRERDSFAGKAQIFRQQRDGAFSSFRSFGDALKRISDTWLLGDPGNPGWNFVASAAMQLLSYAGPSFDLHYTITGHAACGYGEGLDETARQHFLRGTPFEDDEITCAPCRAYLAGLRAGRNTTR